MGVAHLISVTSNGSTTVVQLDGSTITTNALPSTVTGGNVLEMENDGGGSLQTVTIDDIIVSP